MSAAVKLVLTSLRVKVSKAVCPASKLVLLLLMAMVGGVVSGAKVLVDMTTELSACGPSRLTLPAASLNFWLATCTMLSSVLLASGGKTAV